MTTTKAPRVGFFGLLGHGNLGNDGSLEAVLEYLRRDHPDARIDFFCSGPERVTARYGYPAERLHWNRAEYRTAHGPIGIAMKAIGKVVDAVRTLFWVAGHDLVVVPGMGVLEATLPLRPWGFPYSLFLLTLSGRLVRTRVALVSVGANADGTPGVRRMFTWAARLASYRSFRDEISKAAMQQTGLDTSRDPVYPDLAFALPNPAGDPPGNKTVGLGVMDYHGTNDDRLIAGQVHAEYVAKLTIFARWLLDEGYRIRLFTGDNEDRQVADRLIADLRADLPDLAADRLVFEPIDSLSELMRQLTLIDTMVATRYHNVLCALKLGKPTVSIGYAKKNDVLMDEMGLGGFCQNVRFLDTDLLKEQFGKLECHSARLVDLMASRNAANEARLDEQFAILSRQLPGRTTPEGETK